MTFHYTDEAFRIHMPPTNTYAALPSPTRKNDAFVEEMVLKNNSLVTRRHDQKKSDRRGGGGASSLSGFTHFFDNITGRFQLIKDSSDNPRAVPDQSDFNNNNNNNYYGVLPPRRINFSNFVKYPSSDGDFRSSNNKRSRAEEQPGGDGTVQIAQNNNKKLKAILVVDQSNQEEEFLTPPPPPLPRGGDDSLVPDHDLSATPDRLMRKMMIKSAHHDHLVPGPDMSIAASNDAPPPASTHHTIHQHSDNSSAYLESQQWSDDEDEDPDSARRTSYYTRNRSSLHSRSEKKRRYRINKKMRALQDLLPNSNKVDKASVLDEAIDYVKSLQLQLQLLSSGTHMLTSPMMMPQIAMPNLNQFSAAAAAAAAMGLGMVPNQFTMSAMHGFPHMACFPYMLPFHGGPSMTRSSAMAVPVVPETTSIDQTGSIPPPMSGSNYSSYPNDFSQIGFESQLRHN